MKTRLKFPLIAASLMLASACSILPESAPVQMLDPQLQPPPAASKPIPWTLNVARPESDPVRDSTRVLVRTGAGQLQVHASARWVAAAPELLRTRLVRYLRDSQRIAQVSAGAAGMDRTLALDLRAFELVETGDGRLEAKSGSRHGSTKAARPNCSRANCSRRAGRSAAPDRPNW